MSKARESETLLMAPYFVVETDMPGGYVRLAGPRTGDMLLRTTPEMDVHLGERLHLLIQRPIGGEVCDPECRDPQSDCRCDGGEVTDGE